MKERNELQGTLQSVSGQDFLLDAACEAAYVVGEVVVKEWLRGSSAHYFVFARSSAVVTNGATFSCLFSIIFDY